MIQMEHATLGASGRSTTGIKAPGFDGTQPCKDIDLDLFFPDSQIQETECKKVIKPICSTCSFKNPCLEWALKNKELGIWAGTGYNERRSILRRTKRLQNNKAPR